MTHMGLNIAAGSVQMTSGSSYGISSLIGLMPVRPQTVERLAGTQRWRGRAGMPNLTVAVSICLWIES